MRVALVVYDSLETRSGGYFYDRMLVRQLESRGHLVRVISFPFRRYPLGVADNLSSRLLRELIDASQDLLLEDELCHSSLFIMNRRLRKRSKVPIVSVVHHLSCSAALSGSGKALYQALEEMYLSSVDAFVFNSNDSRDVVLGLMGREVPGVVARPGCDHTSMTIGRKDLRPGPLRLLYIGNVLPHKGLDVLIRAMALLRSEDISLDVVGAPADRAYSQRIGAFIRQEGLENRIRFHGYLPAAALNRMLEDCHVLVVPSFYEGYGIICGEAYCHGVPVIASDVGGLRETVPPSAGYRVPPGDPVSLAKKVSFLAHHRDELETMSSSALEHAASMPSWKESMDRAVDFLENLAAGGRTPSTL